MSIILQNVRLSKDLSYDKVACPEGINGYVNQTRNAEKFFVILDFKDLESNQMVSRVYFGQPSAKHNIWPGCTPKELIEHIGKKNAFRGNILTRDGFTTFLFEHEINWPDNGRIDKVFETHSYLKLDGFHFHN